MLHSDGHCLMIIRVVIVDLVELVITVVFLVQLVILVWSEQMGTPRDSQVMRAFGSDYQYRRYSVPHPTRRYPIQPIPSHLQPSVLHPSKMVFFIINGTFFSVVRAKRRFDVRKKMTKLPELEGGGGYLIWAMPERKRAFLYDVFPYLYLYLCLYLYPQWYLYFLSPSMLMTTLETQFDQA